MPNALVILRSRLPGIVLGFAAIALSFGSAAAASERRIRAHVTPPNKEVFREILQSDLDLGHPHGMTFDMLLSREELDSLAAKGCRTEILTENVYDDGLRGGTFLPEYISYAESVTKLNALEAAYPSLADVSIIGSTLNMRPIRALKISDNVAVDEDEPEVLYIGNHHAREVITVIIPLAIADSLLSNYGSDARITDWVDSREIWIVPVLNPDGLNYVEFSDLFWRKNRRPNGAGQFGVDLNRNYNYEWNHDSNGSSGSPSSETYRGPSAASEPEIQAIQNFVNAHQFVFSISYHSFGNWWLWGISYKPGYTVDQDVYAGYGEQVAALNGYEPGNPASSTIYITNGSSDDWLYNSPTHAKIYAMTPEVGGDSDYFNPPAFRIPQLVAENMETAWIALDNADRPTRLAPPGQPALDALPTSTTGDYTVTWDAPTVADTQPVAYELVEKTGPATTTDGFEAGLGNFTPGGWTTSTVREDAGSFSLYSGQADELNRICWMKESHLVAPGENFTFRAWYNIESNWDYFYAIASTDGGRTFVNLAGTNTTMSDPNGNNADNGITGTSSNVFVSMTFSLAAYTGQSVWLGIRYFTDGGTANEGVYVDTIFPVQTWATKTVLSSSIASPSFPITGKTDGVYQYAVRGVDAEGDWGYFSANRPVTVALATSAHVVSGRAAFSLEANRPNPFEGRTSIRFSLPVESPHSLVVYDVAGRRVRELSRGMQDAGETEVTWDGRNDAGIFVPSGVYFYRLDTPAGRLERRAVLRR